MQTLIFCESNFTSLIQKISILYSCEMPLVAPKKQDKP